VPETKVHPGFLKERSEHLTSDRSFDVAEIQKDTVSRCLIEAEERTNSQVERSE